MLENKEQSTDNRISYYVAEPFRGQEVAMLSSYETIDDALQVYFELPNEEGKRLGMEVFHAHDDRVIKKENLIEYIAGIHWLASDVKEIEPEVMGSIKEAIAMNENPIALYVGENYLTIQPTENGQEYTFYDKNFSELDGGIYDDFDWTIQDTLNDLVEAGELDTLACEVIDYEDFMERVETVEQEKFEKVQMEQSTASISFYVAECSEFPSFGEFHENLTLQEAVAIYDKIPSERLHGIKGIGFCLEDGSIYDGNFDLMQEGKILTDVINEIAHYRESPLVQKAISEMQAILDERAEQKDISKSSIKKAKEENTPKKSLLARLHDKQREVKVTDQKAEKTQNKKRGMER
jgi:hypothetical protein